MVEVEVEEKRDVILPNYRKSPWLHSSSVKNT
jgi:hypothetical protein